MFDETLSLRPHISSTCISTFFQLHSTGHIHKFLSLPAAKTFIHSLISSGLDYCNSVLSGLPECDLSKLQCTQNTAVHPITHTKKHERITLILMELHWLLVRQWILFNILVLTYCDLRNSCSVIQSLLTLYISNRALLSACKFILIVPHFTTLSYGEWAFSHLALAKYNSLPPSLTQAPSLLTFKSGLKSFWMHILLVFLFYPANLLVGKDSLPWSLAHPWRSWDSWHNGVPWRELPWAMPRGSELTCSLFFSLRTNF